MERVEKFTLFFNLLYMIIGFTGTRKIKLITKQRLFDLLKVLISFKIDYDTDLAVVHGCAEGTDTYFHNLCLLGNISIIGRPCIPTKLENFDILYDPSPPLKRNKEIVNDCNILIALPLSPSQEELRSGTWATIRYAKAQNKKIIFI